MESDKQVAAKIVDDWFQIGVQDYPNGDCDYYITSKRWEKRSEEAKELKNHIASAIANALQAARTPPPGHIIDDAGVVRKVLGTLPVTADGCVVGVGAQVWFIAYGGTEILWAIIHDSRKGWLQSPVCYSTAKAAEAAKEGKA